MHLPIRAPVLQTAADVPVSVLLVVPFGFRPRLEHRRLRVALGEDGPVLARDDGGRVCFLVVFVELEPVVLPQRDSWTAACRDFCWQFDGAFRACLPERVPHEWRRDVDAFRWDGVGVGEHFLR